MDAPPPRFQCPPGFEAVTPAVALAREGPGTELWLIRAPADFCPQSLEGLPVPLHGLEQLWTGGDNGDNGDNGDSARASALYVLRGGPGGGDCPLLLSPVSPEGSLGCAPPLRGSLTIARSFGTPPPAGRKRRKEKVTAEGTVPPAGTAEGTVPPTGTAEGTVPPAGTQPGEGTVPPAGTAEGTVPPAGTQPGEGTVPPAGTQPGPAQVAPEEPEVAKRKKKKKKHKREEQQ